VSVYRKLPGLPSVRLDNPIRACVHCKKVTRVVDRYVPFLGFRHFCYRGRKACAGRFDRAIERREHLGLSGTPFSLEGEMNAQSWRDARVMRVPPRLPRKVRRALRAFTLGFERLEAVRARNGGAFSEPTTETDRHLMATWTQRFRQAIAVLETYIGDEWSLLITAYQERERERKGEPHPFLSRESIRRSAL
jgi:hypothetical protein